MADTTAFHLSRFFSELTGRRVLFAFAAGSAAPAGEQIFGFYDVIESHTPLLLRCRLSTIARMGGALLGLPEETAIARAAQSTVDEPLRDAMHEVLNIASTAISPQARIVFRGMAKTLAAVPAPAAALLRTAASTRSYLVTMDAATPELLTIFE